MTKRKTPSSVARKSPRSATTKRATTKRTPADTFSPEERAAMRERARELKATRTRKGDAGDEPAVLATIAAMEQPGRAMAERIHAIIRAVAPGLVPRLWYGMPAWARDGKVVCFFQHPRKFNTRYVTFAFTDRATLDDGAMWSTGFALQALGPEEEQRIRALVERAVR
jgi:uncharacterized protein YdhG (YjbR/CyaY superfamily)